VPTYQYACTACGHQLEAVQSFADEPLTECPACEGRLRKLFSSVGVVFKGSGFLPHRLPRRLGRRRLRLGQRNVKDGLPRTVPPRRPPEGRLRQGLASEGSHQRKGRRQREGRLQRDHRERRQRQERRKKDPRNAQTEAPAPA